MLTKISGLSESVLVLYLHVALPPLTENCVAGEVAGQEPGAMITSTHHHTLSLRCDDSDDSHLSPDSLNKTPAPVSYLH